LKHKGIIFFEAQKFTKELSQKFFVSYVAFCISKKTFVKALLWTFVPFVFQKNVFVFKKKYPKCNNVANNNYICVLLFNLKSP